MSADGYAAQAKQATAYTRDSKGKLQKAQLASATSFAELIDATKKHFKTERALALILTDRLPSA